MNKNIMFALFIISMFLIAGCNSGTEGGVNPFLGGTTGVSMEFVEGSPPAEVTDGGTFDFDVLVSLRNDGEQNIHKDDIKVSLHGIDFRDFSANSLDDLKDAHPEDILYGRDRDTEGNIIEGTPLYVKFPKTEGEFLNYNNQLIGDRKDFTIRADMCYVYQTTGMAQYCILRDLLNVRDDALCRPSGSKPIYSTGAPVQLNNFKQTVAGKNKVGFSFDIVHMGNGYIFNSQSGVVDCPSDSSARRRNINKVLVAVESRVDSVSCIGLSNGNNGLITLVNGKRSIMCTIDLNPDRSDYEKELQVTLNYNYQDTKDTTILIKHLLQ